jgi:hypothetical protein
MFIFITRRTQIHIFCIFGLFYIATCFGCPEQSSSGRAWIHTKSKGERPFLTNSSCEVFLISNFRRVVNALCFLLSNSPASEFCIPTFRNTLFHLHRQVGMKNNNKYFNHSQTELLFFIPTCLWRWNRVFRNAGIQNSDARELPRRKHTTAAVTLLQNNDNKTVYKSGSQILQVPRTSVCEDMQLDRLHVCRGTLLQI